MRAAVFGVFGLTELGVTALGVTALGLTAPAGCGRGDAGLRPSAAVAPPVPDVTARDGRPGTGVTQPEARPAGTGTLSDTPTPARPDSVPGGPGVNTRSADPALADAPPVMRNATLPFRYPGALYARKVQGDVTLRLWVDSVGRVRPESTRVAESSGTRLLDSAALAGSARLVFTPARRGGRPVAAPLLFPVHFRHPGVSPSVPPSGAGASGAGASAGRTPATHRRH